jgi:hypothetical protein
MARLWVYKYIEWAQCGSSEERNMYFENLAQDSFIEPTTPMMEAIPTC